MPTMRCPECTRYVSPDADTCPVCGYKLVQPTAESLAAVREKAEKRIGTIANVVFVLIVIFTICVFYGLLLYKP